MGVDDVEPVGAVAPVEVGGGPCIRAAAARREREHLDVDSVDSAQRVYLVADEAAERRAEQRSGTCS